MPTPIINIVRVTKKASIVEIFFALGPDKKNICPVTMRLIIRLPFFAKLAGGKHV